MPRLFSLTALLTLWLTAWATAVEVTAGPSIDVQGTTATVRWTTDVVCGTVFKYGLDADHLNHKADGPLGLQHTVSLTGLTDGKIYHYSAGTAKKPLKTGQFTVGKTAPPPPAPAVEKKPSPAKPAPVVKPAPAPKPAAPPARATWGDMGSLQDHYVRHGRDFAAVSAEDYAAKAWAFLQRAIDEGWSVKVDEDGVIRVYEARTKSFASYNRSGRTKTFFKPQRPDYFRDQPGKVIRLTRPTQP